MCLLLFVRRVRRQRLQSNLDEVAKLRAAVRERDRDISQFKRELSLLVHLSQKDVVEGVSEIYHKYLKNEQKERGEQSGSGGSGGGGSGVGGGGDAEAGDSGGQGQNVRQGGLLGGDGCTANELELREQVRCGPTPV